MPWSSPAAGGGADLSGSSPCATLLAWNLGDSEATPVRPATEPAERRSTERIRSPPSLYLPSTRLLYPFLIFPARYPLCGGAWQTFRLLGSGALLPLNQPLPPCFLPRSTRYFFFRTRRCGLRRILPLLHLGMALLAPRLGCDPRPGPAWRRTSHTYLWYTIRTVPWSAAK